MRLLTPLLIFTLLLCVCVPLEAYTVPKTVNGFASGLATVGYTLYTPSTGVQAVARTTTGVHEIGATGVYTVAMPGTDGTEYSVIWDDGLGHYAPDTLRDPALATAPIKAKTDLIATNAADSANAVTAQGNAGTAATQSTTAATQSTAANTRVQLALPAIAPGANGGLPTGDASGRVLLQPTQTGVTIPNVTLVGTLTTYTGNTPQTGDSYARIGAAGAGLTAIGDTRLGFLTGDVYARIGVNGAGLTALGDTRLANLDASIAGIPAAFLALPLGSSPWNSVLVSDALKMGWAGYGKAKVVISGTTMTIYAPDGTTVLKAFTLSPAQSTPSSRQ
jgi:hypothetical protein